MVCVPRFLCVIVFLGVPRGGKLGMIYKNWLLAGLLVGVNASGVAAVAEVTGAQKDSASTVPTKPASKPIKTEPPVKKKAPATAASKPTAKAPSAKKSSGNAPGTVAATPQPPGDPVLSAKQAAEQWKVQRAAVLDGMDGELR